MTSDDHESLLAREEPAAAHVYEQRVCVLVTTDPEIRASS